MSHAELLTFLESGRDPVEGVTRAHWLHSDYTAPIWVVGASQYQIRWNRILPDGVSLVDPRYSKLLNTAKRLYFESRGAPIIAPINEATHIRFSEIIFGLIEWTVYNKQYFRPEQFAFEAIDREGMADLIALYISGGIDSVRYVIPRLKQIFLALCSDAPLVEQLRTRRTDIPLHVFRRNPEYLVAYDFSDDQIDLIRSWLHLNGYFERLGNGTFVKSIKAGYLNRYRIGELLHIHHYTTSPEVSLFLRQFEYVQNYRQVELVSRYRHRECVPVDHESTEDMAKRPISAKSLSNLQRLLTNCQMLSPYIEGLPPLDVLSRFAGSNVVSDTRATPPGQTRTVPTEIALHILNKAIGYIHEYGEDLVEYFLAWSKNVQTLKDAKSGRIRRLIAMKRRAFALTPQPEKLAPLNITSLYTAWGARAYRNPAGGNSAAAMARQGLNLEDAISLLIVSVYIVVAIMSARRRGELVDLRLDSLQGSEGSFEVQFDLEKFIAEGVRAQISRPIPNIAAKGIEQLQRLTKDWMSFLGDLENTSLFYFPVDLQKGQPMVYTNIQYRLDQFSDYFQVPVDSNGCRWYVKSHEFRRFFAIVFFWQFKYANLAALQWMLGHANIEQTYAYVRSIVGGREMTHQEARYSRVAMLDGADDSALRDLRALALKHFRTTDVALIAEDDLVTYLESLIERGVYKVRPHGIETSDGTLYEMLFEIQQAESP